MTTGREVDTGGRSAMRDRVGSLDKGLAVMEILALHPAGMTLTAMAEEAGLTRAGARRFLLTLCASGYATQSGRLFSLSPKLLGVARTWLQGAPLWTHADPFMRAVASELNESCSAAVLSGADVVYVARVPGRRILSVALTVGTRLPAWCTSMGRVLLSDLSPAELKRFLDSATIERRTPKSIINRQELAGRIGEASRDGFAIVDEELEIGLRSIAVPVRDRMGRIIAAINVSTQSARFSSDDMRREILPKLTEAARKIEAFVSP
ncbi:MAG: helix-turn-helix domain-containing protein [Alphaproteobacteria bacterium]|nr:helix-turn-helix domain-containing protein [Alphaproteobacteria bacterium]MBU0805984.1 helix-turn-helix domain-containing protein [Alphaproteobacteria bacterium]MBU0874047.1 helix-turn-helix domain-containing protein [Alphaproteobacteria bacterium]MBU1402129.1 helix-turn-helix domain-containing protein [Alphaproteobacteria bacterium]MBU1590774.1 helix-turn-helix domain-containing protein [Alphaproteobacteria bacterium]